MCLLSRLVYSCQPLVGGAFISKLHAYTKHGDIDSNLVVKRIIRKVCTPLYHAITRWIMYGELLDNYQEFFVAKRSDNSSTNTWHDLYYLRNRLIPTFLPLSLANKILVIGKSINFILTYRHSIGLEIDKNKVQSKISLIKNKMEKRRTDINRGMQTPTVADALGFQQNSFSNQITSSSSNLEKNLKFEVMKKNAQLFALNNIQLPPNSPSHNSSEHISLLNISADTESSIHNLTYGDEDKLDTVVTSLLSTVDRKLLDMMISGFHLLEHLEGLKKFMLLGQGDFIIFLMDSVGPELQKPASKLYRFYI